MSLRRKKAPRGLFGWAWRLLLLALVWLVGVAAYIIWVGQRDDAAPADAIIVLGAAAYDAKPSPVFEERIRHGIDLYKRGLAPTLIFTGGYGGAGARFSESQVARRYALRQGVPDARFGERICAVVEPEPNAEPTLPELSAHVHGELAGYKAPRELVVVDSIGRAPNGKVDYKAVKERALAALGVPA